MPEVWKTVKDAPDYEVSDLGRVRRARPGQGSPGGFVHPSPNKTGTVYVYLGKRRGKRPLARVVAMAFVPWVSWSPSLVVTFHDGDRSNCRADNLGWQFGRYPRSMQARTTSNSAEVPPKLGASALSDVELRLGVMSEITLIEYPKFTLRVRVLKPDAEVEADARYTVMDFWQDFTAAGRVVRAPIRPLTSEDAGIAHNLIKKYEPTLLRELARLFWSRYSQTVFDNPDTHTLRLFAARIPDIRKEM